MLNPPPQTPFLGTPLHLTVKILLLGYDDVCGNHRRQFYETYQAHERTLWTERRIM